MEEEILKIPEIIMKEINQKTSEDEKEILQKWLSQSSNNRVLYDKLRHADNLASIAKEYRQIDSQSGWEKIVNQLGNRKIQNRKNAAFAVLKYAAAIAVPLIVVSSYFIYKETGHKPKTIFSELKEQLGGLEESSLIMANGEVINLHAKLKESIIDVDGTQISKVDSTLLYRKKNLKKGKAIEYNSLMTPRGKVFTVVFSDGTKVWLNASSAIKYPTHFSSDSRKVYLIGEAYFKVTKDRARPFTVSTTDMDIEVHGTSFNVKAYPEDKTIETTLVEGLVDIKTSQGKMELEPGMQARLDKETNSLDKFHVKTDPVTSWIFGKYIFEYENLENVMAHLSQWYNVDVFFDENRKRTLHFTGTLYKYEDINNTLHIIELTTNVKFKISGNTIIVN